MSQETICDEIRLQVEGDLDHARHNPRYYTYRIITILGLETSLNTISSLDDQILEFVGEDNDDEDSFSEAEAGSNATDEHPDNWEEENFEEDPDEWPEISPFTEEEETELLAKFPDDFNLR